MCRIDNLLDRKQLMKIGIALIIIGHLNFILGAIIHGTVLRHVTSPENGSLVEYSVTNVMSAISGILTICTGIAVIVLSGNLSRTILQYIVFASSMLNSLMSMACLLGLGVSVVITIANGGRTLLTVCHLSSTKDVLQITNECPFDPTRIYDTTLAMWIPSLVLTGVETFLSIRCFFVSVNLLGIKKKPLKSDRKQVRQKSSEEIQETDEDSELLEETTVRFWV
ncbi:keratinocyte-associated protein 3-like isoform X1 [Chiloscyllium plagiosum]|uniref:keratinocyte-associated protein 3-like isoform X1 n=1 Tax=Chiloscyllium plagiosum TaxID=36176 RepID=UPI001CB860AD|nr:keratinocyte-associated protein 3-like isoform X1 [Chiloscyllium plagiosum]